MSLTLCCDQGWFLFSSRLDSTIQSNQERISADDSTIQLIGIGQTKSTFFYAIPSQSRFYITLRSNFGFQDDYISLLSVEYVIF
jgi:hypothetical protein